MNDTNSAINQGNTLPKKDRLSASLLALFFGTLGIHKFYLKQNTVGIIYIVTIIISFGILAFIPAILSFIDSIRYLLMSDEEFNEAVNSDKLFEVVPMFKNKIVYSLLAIVVGGFGFHKFYVGKKQEGYLYLGIYFGLTVLFVGMMFISFIGALNSAVSTDTLSSDANSSAIAIGASSIFLLIGYIGTILSLTIPPFIAMIEGVLALFKSQNEFDEMIQEIKLENEE